MSLTPEQLADTIFSGFAIFREFFESFSDQAQWFFESQDWHALQNLAATRLASNNQHIERKSEDIRGRYADGQLPDTATWQAAKVAYAKLLQQRFDYDLGETFFNSVYRRLNPGSSIKPDQTFIHSAFDQPPMQDSDAVFERFQPSSGVVDMLQRVLHSLNFTRPWQNFDRDVRNVVRSLTEERPEITSTDGLELELLNSLFYRNKGAYAIGKLSYKGQHWPVALPILTDARGQLFVDTLICDEDELSIMFSFTRSYFLVDTHHPSALVSFLHDLLPNKKRSELFAAIGLHKHGKTEFYRAFLQHLDHSDDEFVVAAGIKGMVMSVFSLPSFQTVFKVIKDRFSPSKNITHKEVREKYYIVKLHDRVGRMADTQEFENLSFPRSRFAQELIDELLEVAPSSIIVDEDQVTIKHLYTERLMTPLNMYIESADEKELKEALDEYGNAIRQLAAANIFPGDMLLKNFGVTRHGRVVFYDYDEICYLTDVNFRRIPEPQTPEQEMSAEVWYSVAKNDVFPEEFKKFLFGKPRVKQMFTEAHGELFDAAYWQQLQRDINEGEIKDVFPYRRKRRFLPQT